MLLVIHHKMILHKLHRDRARVRLGLLCHDVVMLHLFIKCNYF